MLMQMPLPQIMKQTFTRLGDVLDPYIDYKREIAQCTSIHKSLEDTRRQLSEVSSNLETNREAQREGKKEIAPS